MREHYDDDLDRFRIEVTVTNRWFGPLFGYHGSFVAAYPDAVTVPASIKPVRETARA